MVTEMVVFRGHRMAESSAVVLEMALNSMTYAEIAERLGVAREYIKNLVNRFRSNGFDVPRVPRSKHKDRNQKLCPQTQKMIDMANSGMASAKIADEMGLPRDRVSNRLSFHRGKGAVKKNRFNAAAR